MLKFELFGMKSSKFVGFGATRLSLSAAYGNDSFGAL